jgi:hypothetical protein
MGINYPIQNGLPSLYIQNPTLMVPLELPPQVLCQLEAPHQLGALQVQGEADQSSFPPLQLLDGSGSATPPVCPHTAPGPPHPRYGPTWPQVHPATPTRNDDAGPLPSLWPLPVAHVLVQHQHHLISASVLPSALQVAVALVLGEPTPRPSLPLGLGVPHLQNNTKDSVNIHIYIYNQMIAIKITKHNPKTYLSDPNPPQEATSYQGHVGSPYQHMDTSVSPVAYVTTHMPPWP